jgi:hypothetical protein
MASSKPADYDTGVDNQTVHNNRASAYLKAKKPAIDGFGTLMQDFKADQYLGKRVRFSVFVKSEEVQNWAGLWMRIDKGTGSANYKMLAFDNMQDRPIKGTTGWQNCEVVLDVAPDATGIYFGILLGEPERCGSTARLSRSSRPLYRPPVIPIPLPTGHRTWISRNERIPEGIETPCGFYRGPDTRR